MVVRRWLVLPGHGHCGGESAAVIELFEDTVGVVVKGFKEREGVLVKPVGRAVFAIEFGKGNACAILQERVAIVRKAGGLHVMAVGHPGATARFGGCAAGNWTLFQQKDARTVVDSAHCRGKSRTTGPNGDDIDLLVPIHFLSLSTGYHGRAKRRSRRAQPGSLDEVASGDARL